MRLETERLILRPPAKKDVKDLVEGLNNIKVSRYLSSVAFPYTKKHAFEWIKITQKEARKKKREKYNFAIELKSEKKDIGGIGVFDYSSWEGSAEIGYWLNEKYWKMGIMSEALQRILEFCFNTLKVRRVVIGTYTDNVASNILIKKFGLKLEATFREDGRPKSTGKIHSTHYYGLLRSEWKKKK